LVVCWVENAPMCTILKLIFTGLFHFFFVYIFSFIAKELCANFMV